MDRIEARLHELGYRFWPTLPERPFDHVKVVNDLAYVSGQGPVDEAGRLIAVGRVGADVTVDVAYQGARRTAVNCLGVLKQALGDLERIEEVVKVLVFVNSDKDFHGQPLVANGFTDLLVEVLGARGRHARSAIGTSNLPNNQSIEAEMIVRVRL